MNTEQRFREVKTKVLQLIKDETRHVTFSKTFRTSGIYMLYVNCEYDDHVLPIYIGQTKDFVKRFQAHIRDIRKLNDLAPYIYHNKFFWSAWSNYSKDFEGKFKQCKVFQYMVDHHCTFDDLRMLVIEFCNEELLKDKEHYYINDFLSAYFGFNQIDSISNPYLYNENREKYNQYIQKDGIRLNLYMDYGYSKFNYLQGYRSVENNPYRESMEERANASKLMLTSEERERKKQDCLKAHEEYSLALEQQTPLMHNAFASDIHDIFVTYKLKSQRRENEVLFAFLNHHRSQIDPYASDKIDYLEYYFNRDRKTKECGQKLTEYFRLHAEKIEEISAPVMKNFNAYVILREQFISNSRFSLTRICVRKLWNSSRQLLSGSLLSSLLIKLSRILIRKTRITQQ